MQYQRRTKERQEHIRSPILEKDLLKTGRASQAILFKLDEKDSELDN